LYHQRFGVSIRSGKARKKMRPKGRPLEGDFVSDEAFAALLRA